MAITSTALPNTSINTVYTSSGQSVVPVIYLCNIGTAQSFDMHIVSSGDTADETNLVYTSVPITDSDTYVIDSEKLVLGNGDFIAVKAGIAYSAGVSGLIVTVCYMGA